jgi:hypothetical protein
MSWKVAIFEIACWVSLTAITAYFTVTSLRDRRVHPGIWMTLGIVAISWMEAPYDRAMYVQFNPELHRLPAIGPLAAAQGGLPVMAPPGYVMYFLAPAMVAVAIAQWLIRRRATRPMTTLVVVGIAVGIAFDALMQFGQAQFVPLWVFSRSAPYVTAFPGTQQQIPLYDLLALGAMIMWATVLLGTRDANGDSFIERAARRRFSSPGPRLLATAVGYIVLIHLLYLYVLLPHLILWWGQMLTVTGVLQPFAEIAVQPAGPQSNGAVGAVLIVVWLAAGIIVTYVLARRIDARSLRRGFAVEGSAPKAASAGAAGAQA